MGFVGNMVHMIRMSRVIRMRIVCGMNVVQGVIVLSETMPPETSSEVYRGFAQDSIRVSCHQYSVLGRQILFPSCRYAIKYVLPPKVSYLRPQVRRLADRRSIVVYLVANHVAGIHGRIEVSECRSQSRQVNIEGIANYVRTVSITSLNRHLGIASILIPIILCLCPD